MRKIISVLVLCIIILTACSGNSSLPNNKNTTPITTNTPDAQPSPTTSLDSEEKVLDYFVVKKDVRMKYKGTGNEYAGYETYVEYAKENLIQLRKLNGGTETVQVYKIKDGSLICTYFRGETYYKYDYTSLSNRDEIVLKEPIKTGTSWTLDDGSKRSITAVDKLINTPAGEFQALEVTTKRKDSSDKAYYVKNVGLIKSEYIADDNSLTVVSELESIENPVPFKRKVRFYFPQFNKDRIVYIDRDIEISTNQDMKFKFQKELKTIPENSGLSKVLSVNTSVLGCSVNEIEDTVTVDFSANLTKEMNAGTSLESMLLKSITNTFGEYYQKSKVIITIEGKPYTSGHIAMKQGEYFTVEKENIIQY